MSKTKRIVGKPFVKGKSGNPGGRPATLKEFREAIQAQGATLYECTLRLAKGGKKIDARDQLTALKLLFEYGYGRPAQTVEISGSVTIPAEIAGLSDAELAKAAVGVLAKLERPS